MESLTKKQSISKKERDLKNMKLSQSQEGITHLTVSDEKERKKLWDEWKKLHPNSKKTWRITNKQKAHTLRCQATVVIKKVSAIVRREPTNSEDSESVGFENDDNHSDDTDSIYSENSDADGWANSGDTGSIKSENSDIDGLRNFGRTNSVTSETNELDTQDNVDNIEQDNIETHRPILTTSNQRTISKLYIDDETLAQWSQENLMAYTFPIDPFPVRAPSETNRYEMKRFFEYIPEKMRQVKKEEQEFFDEISISYPEIKTENIKTEWITLLCHEEILTQGEIDEHVVTSHKFEMSRIKDEYRIQRNKISNLILRDAKDIRTQSEHSLDRLMESWYESAVANNILINDNGRSVDKIRPEKSMILLEAISKVVDPILMETFKVNLGGKVKESHNINTSFSCTWEELEETIQESLGQSQNIERLKKCMEPKDWGNTSLQHALQNINNFHESMLSSKKMIYKKEDGEYKDYIRHKESMKMQSATNLLKNLPDKFDVIRDDMLKDMSDAYFDAETTYEKVIEKTEEKVKNRGLNMLYTATGISNEQTRKPAIYAMQRKERIPGGKNRDVKKEILDIIKHANPKLTGDIMNNISLKKK